MSSPQTLSLSDRRIVAAWAADCAERVLWIFESDVPGELGPRHALVRTRAFANDEVDISKEIRQRFVGGHAVKAASTPAAKAAASAAGQASAVVHMGAHALGAAAYAVKAANLVTSHHEFALQQEIQWQLQHMSSEVRAALGLLPLLGENTSGPLGPGLLASGVQGTVIRILQTEL